MKLASSTVTLPILLETLCLGWWWLVVQSLSHVQFFVTPWAVAYQAPLSGILQARVLEWVAISFSRRSSRPRDRMCFSCVSCLAGRFFTTKSQGKPSFLGWLLIVNQDVVNQEASSVFTVNLFSGVRVRNPGVFIGTPSPPLVVSKLYFFSLCHHETPDTFAVQAPSHRFSF